MLVDRFNRKIEYLRVSITDRCNLKCIYCVPENGVKLVRFEDILRYEEIAEVVKVAVSLGINRIRITGGEPLVRKDVLYLFQMLKEIDGIKDLSLTTNGVLLSRYASQLKMIGVNRVNISLDTLKNDKYKEITRGGNLDDVLKGIESAIDYNLSPVKINTVMIKGVNDDELFDFARLTFRLPVHLRFIEYMPFKYDRNWSRDKVIPNQEILNVLYQWSPLVPFEGVIGNGPAKYYKFPEAKGSIGFISPISQHFCPQCNRLRLNAMGMLRSCLFSNLQVDLRPALRGNNVKEELIKLFFKVVGDKQESSPNQQGFLLPGEGNMVSIGG